MTIPEVMVAVVILLLGVLVLFSLVDRANGASLAHRQREAATALARDVLENAGAISYDDVTPINLVPALQSRRGLGDSSPSPGYTIARSGVIFTVATDVCSLDDPHDGTGSHITGTDGVQFCSGSAPDGTSDDRPADYRRATTTVSWTIDGRTRQVRQSSFVMPPTGSDLPVVTGLTPSSTPPITTNATSVNFSATTSSIPAGLTWSQDGGDVGQATGSGLSWNFTWPISGLVDGDYVIGARARTGGGSYGPPRSLTVRLNRFAPMAPANFVAGINGSTIDSEWLANKERDIIGYRVYRQQTYPSPGTVQPVDCGSGTTPVSTRSTTCTDASPLPFAPAQIQQVGGATTGSVETNTVTPGVTVNTPAGVASGDVLFAVVAVSGDGAITPPPGWTAIRDVPSSATSTSAIRSATYYHVVGTGEPASHVWTVGTGRSVSASIVAGRGVDNANPVDVSASQASGTTTGTTETAPTVTTTGPARGIVRFFSHRVTGANLTLSTPPNYSQLSTGSSATTLHARYYASQGSAGATGPAQSTCSNATKCNGEWLAQTVAVRPANVAQANYWVSAVDYDTAGNPRVGATSNTVPAYAANRPPAPPSGLAPCAIVDGGYDVTWPSQGDLDPDSGDRVAFYRVYRDGARFDRTNTGSDTKWTDVRPGGSHTYYLKAVDTHLAESSPSVTVTCP